MADAISITQRVVHIGTGLNRLCSSI